MFFYGVAFGFAASVLVALGVGARPRSLRGASPVIQTLQSMNARANKRGAGKGGTAVLWRAGRTRPALPDANVSLVRL